jgi:hypothetical protein
MIQTRTVIRPTRSVRDIYHGRKYRVVARFPGGREIDRGYAETRPRAFKKALVVNRPQTSPTAGAVNYDEAATPYDSYTQWKLYGDNDILFQ